MKRTIISITILLVSFLSISAQTVNSMYFMDKWSQRNTYNASFAPESGYFTLPVFGGISLGVSTNVGVSNFIYPYNSELVTFLHPSVDGQAFINGLNPDNYIRQSLNLNLFSFGFYTQDNSFWSLNVSMKENLNSNLPIDLFRLVKLGMVNTTNNIYNLKNLSVDQTDMAQISLGYSKDINPKIRVGANVKMLLGLSAQKINYTQFDVSLSESQFNVNAVGESLMMSDFISSEKDADNYYDLSKTKVNGSKLKTSGFGFAIDLGVTYKPIDKLTLAASINDLGSIGWDKSKTKRGVATGNIQFSGFSNVDVKNVDLNSQIDSLKNDLSKLVKFKDEAVSKNMTDIIPSTINISAEYSIFGNKKQDVTVGMLFQSYNSKMYSVNELVGAITLKPISWISFSATCEFLRKDANRIGLALNICPEWINLYVASDFISPKLNPQYLPINGTSMNISIGGSINIGRHKKISHKIL